ncbi:MAG: benzoate-CoA ligase family protein [Gemmatimonadaceae bacterium]|nr:benzoate-CoA ligase family protein [Gemmatimonadaceae bacterium]
MPSAHVDGFARDNLPPAALQPDFLFTLPSLQFPPQLNCATELLDRHIADGRGDRVCLRSATDSWTYADLHAQANRVANVLVWELGLVPGNRVLLRAPNNPMMVAAWFGVIKAGGIAVATMPLLRAVELQKVIEKARVSIALCDATLATELQTAIAQSSERVALALFNTPAADSLDARMARVSADFTNVDTAADDTCIIAFTSGTTGQPKGTMHFHRDVMAICACWPPHILRPRPDDVFIGSPPLAFTFGLGGLVLFPMQVGASAVLLEKPSPQNLLDAIVTFGATTLFTAPTTYRAMAAHGATLRASSLRQCVSAGEVLPTSTRTLWRDATGIEMIDGIGATEMLHIFISADETHARAGATGTPVPGYVATVLDEDGNPAAIGTVGRLAVKGPTGCRYLADERQRGYVLNGWNLTGDAYVMDADGYFHYQSRTDDMIISSGYNIAAPEVEDALLRHAAVAECGVIGVDDADRGQIVKAYVVLREEFAAGDVLTRELQDFVKATIAPYKYPRAIEFRAQLPRTETGKLQRFRLRESS